MNRIMKPTVMTINALFALVVLSASTSCNPDKDDVKPGTETPAPEPPVAPDPDQPPTPEPAPPTSNRLQVTIGSATFTATLSDNATAQAFKKRLPMTVRMQELNGNEKYYYLDTGLPTAAVNQGTIRAGDLMLYGSNCMVLFYDTFQTSYSYTRIGKLDNVSGLKTAVGTGSVTVSLLFE